MLPIPSQPALTDIVCPPDTGLSSRLLVRAMPLSELDESLRRAWEELGEKALEPNPFLSPAFVLPAIRHLTPRAKPLLVLVEQSDGYQTRLLGLGVFQLVRWSKMLPLRHWVAYRSRHSYLTGLLLDAECPEATLESLLSFLVRPEHGVHGLEFTKRRAEGQQAEWLTPPGGLVPMRWVGREYTRPVINITEPPVSPPPLRKTLKSSRTKLHKLGTLDVRFRVCGPEVERCAEVFLQLENQGWKARQGSALAAQTADRQFFQKMITGFARNRQALFAEMTLDNRVIASTCNLLAGSGGFGFKAGWHPDFSRHSPGMLLFHEFHERIAEALPGLTLFDSCTAPDSYLASLWPDSCRIATGVFTTTFTGHLAARSMLRLKDCQERLKTWRAAKSPSHARSSAATE